MNKYDSIVDLLQYKIDNDEITYELAEKVNDLAYEKYVLEYKADTAIVSESKSCYASLAEETKKFFNCIDNKVPDVINKLKKAPKDTKIKMSSGIKKAIENIDKEVPDMLTNMNKYTKGTVYGKTTFIAANIGGWTIPPLIPIPGASEMLFTVAEVMNYLLEFKRKWSGSNRSAINDFINKCSNATDNLNNVGAEKTALSAKKLFKYMSNTLNQIVNAAMIVLQGNIIKGYKKVYAGTEAIADKVSDKTKDSKNAIGKNVNKFSNKLSKVSGELSSDADKAIEAKKKFSQALKDKRESKREIKRKILPT